jgi:hypothetical protein
VPAAPLLSPEQLRRFGAYAAGPHPMLRDRLADTRNKLLAEPDGRYSLELFVAENSDPARAERFLARARELVPLEDVYVMPMASADRHRLRVTLGLFEDKEAARQAAQRLPPKYRKAFPLEPRSLAELRAAI